MIWDPAKAEANVRKHGIRFADAEGVLFDPNTLTEEDEHLEDEQRFVSIGLDPVGRLLVVVYTFRGEDIRLISARRATRQERRAYEAGI
ncbi:BrnT family toxin [Candidatus Methylomirabilis sp.]|uniref:BrnT family toxin n=1 Tax=Candidatus Methylomirabilis sp. TaxID=2032687 RepID=UPI003C73DCFC